MSSTLDARAATVGREDAIKAAVAVADALSTRPPIR
jgi:hypothetical protein